MTLRRLNPHGNVACLWTHAVVILCCLLLPSCESLGKKKEEPKKSGGPLVLNPPKMRSDQKKEKEKWTTLRMPTGTAFVQAKDAMDDVISLSAVESGKSDAIKTLDDVETLVRSQGLKFASFKRSQVLGEMCIRYERIIENDEQENEAVRAALNTSGRRIAGPHTTRTLGAIFLHPHQPGRYVTLTCSRTSYHGEIGDYYQELFDDFLSAFVAENAFQTEPYGILN